MTPEDRIAKYRSAYERANGRGCHMTYKNGWYRLHFNSYRAPAIDEMIARLEVATPPDIASGEIGGRP